jgi:3-dehydroquinate synthase
MIEKIAAYGGYDVVFESIDDFGLEDFLQSNFEHAQKIILADENTYKHCLEYLITSVPALAQAEVLVVPAGESSKTIETASQLWSAMLEYGISRNAVCINLGGGVITDLGGFVSALYKRGIDCIHIPTSLLAMVDASVGGKTGVDFEGVKNQIGVFYFPKLVLCDTAFLATLPEIEIRSGYAEALKHGLINSRELWEKTKTISPKSIDKRLLREIVQVKNEVVLRDPLEKNWRKALNLGHTIGHAIESLFLEKNPIPHGVAVAWGLVYEAKLATIVGLLKYEEFQDIHNHIVNHYGVPNNLENHLNELINWMKKDKKNDADGINFSLLAAIGDVKINQIVAEEQIKEALLTAFQ